MVLSTKLLKSLLFVKAEIAENGYSNQIKLCSTKHKDGYK